MRYWVKQGTMYYEKPEKTMYCEQCGEEVFTNDTGFCDICLDTALIGRLKREKMKHRAEREKEMSKKREWRNRTEGKLGKTKKKKGRRV